MIKDEKIKAMLKRNTAYASFAAVRTTNNCLSSKPSDRLETGVQKSFLAKLNLEKINA